MDHIIRRKEEVKSVLLLLVVSHTWHLGIQSQRNLPVIWMQFKVTFENLFVLIEYVI